MFQHIPFKFDIPPFEDLYIKVVTPGKYLLRHMNAGTSTDVRGGSWDDIMGYIEEHYPNRVKSPPPIWT